MPSLTPEQRPDRNGKVTTRWVRDDSTQPSKTLPTNPPAITSPDINSVSAEDVPFLHSIMKWHVIARNRGVNVSAMDPHAARAIEHIIMEANSHSQMSYGDVRAEITSAVDDAGDKASAGIGPDTFVMLNNIAALYVVPSYGRTASFEAKHYAYGLRMLDSRRYKNVQDFLELPEGELKRARALCKVIDSIDKTHVVSSTGEHDGERNNGYDGHHYTMLDSDELAEYVLEHPDMVDDIIDVINERAITDVEDIRNFLEVDEPALRDGLL